MELLDFLRGAFDSDPADVCICAADHTIVYMNPACIRKHAHRGGADLVGKSLMNCHEKTDEDKINRILDWFREDETRNRIFIAHNDKENSDRYMYAVRDGEKNLIGYWEKAEFRTPDSSRLYDFSNTVNYDIY